MTQALHKGYLPGSIGAIVTLHARYYSHAAGFGLPFESKVARELSLFCEGYDEARDGLWLAVRDGQIVGSVAIDGSHAGEDGAHLRWFIVADALRGQGLGTALLSAAVEFCRTRHYGRVYLWTFAGLDAARHLYEKFGFCLVLQQQGAQWGVTVDEQRFELRI
jgi:GNAT superfamily N-acetyltransferase